MLNCFRNDVLLFGYNEFGFILTLWISISFGYDQLTTHKYFKKLYCWLNIHRV